jgi:hypothetical protein
VERLLDARKGKEKRMRVLDYAEIDAMSVVELPDRNVVCDCGCALIEVNILSGDNFYIGSFDNVQTAVDVCGNQIGGNAILIDNSGAVTQDPSQTAWVECDTTQTIGVPLW